MRLKRESLLIKLLLVILCSSSSFAQDLEKHEWKNRVLIVISKDSNQLQNQIDILKKDLKGLKERKLVIYKMNPKQYVEGIHSTNWVTNPYFYYRTKKTKEDFEVVLIGLDGGTKLRQTQLLTLKKLFTLIDGMPMRKMEKKNE